MSLRVAVGASAAGDDALDFVRQAEALGVDSLWSAETWGADAFTPLAYLAAHTSTVKLGTGIAQLGARTPAMLAMTAFSMQALSRGRFILGLGTSGPQVIEGWHGVRFDRPVRRTRETIEIVRMVTSGERLRYDGEIYRLPLPDSAGRALRPAAPPVPVPIYVASLGPANLRLTGELADGWIGTGFMPETAQAFFEPIAQGAARSGRSLRDFDYVVAAAVEFTDDVEAAATRHARGYAFTFGAMGSAEKNFYNDAFERQGYGDDVRAVQRLWLDGRREEAAERVPIDIGLRTNLLGTEDMVRDRLRLYRGAGITTIRAGLSGTTTDERLQTLERLLGLVDEVNAEAR